MKKRCLYIARYNPIEFSDVDVENINFSVNRKINGIAAALRKAGFTCIIIRTSTGKGDVFAGRKIKKRGDSIVFTPKVINFINRPLSYLVNTFLISAQVFFLSCKKKPDLSIFWDLLPDTTLPALMAKIGYFQSKIILDLEEFISSDPLAPKLFRLFESLMLQFKWSSILSSGMDLKGKIKNDECLVIKGFYAENLKEEIFCEKLLLERCESIGQSIKNILFTGRIDKLRGYEQFLELAILMKDTNYRFIAFGFGNEKLVNYYKKKSKGFVDTRFYAKRSEVLSEIIRADICFNYLADKDFIAGSFPSKLIEYYCLGGLVATNHKVNLPEEGVHLFSDIKELAKNLTLNNLNYVQTDRQTYRAKFSIGRTAETLKGML